MRLRNVCGLLICLAPVLLSDNMALAQGSGTPSSRWVDTMATTYYEARGTGDVRLARFGNTDAMVPLLNGLRASLTDARNQQLGMPDRIAIVTGYRSIWKGDALQQPAWDLRVARLKQLPDAEVGQWQKALTVANGDQVSEAWTMAFMSDMTEMFPNEKFDTAKSGMLRTRAGVVPADAVQALADALKMGRAYAAVLLVQNQDFFSTAEFSRVAFDNAIRSLKAKLSEPAATAVAATGVLRGTIVDSKGQPIADAAVTIQSLDRGELKFDTTTNARGQYLRNVPPGKYKVTAVKQGVGAQFVTAEVLSAAPTDANITIAPGPG